jgi:hypothetical protein
MGQEIKIECHYDNSGYGNMETSIEFPKCLQVVPHVGEFIVGTVDVDGRYSGEEFKITRITHTQACCHLTLEKSVTE